MSVHHSLNYERYLAYACCKAYALDIQAIGGQVNAEFGHRAGNHIRAKSRA